MRENGKTEPTYLISIPISTKMEKLKMLLKGFPQLLDLSELESCKWHFDDEVDQLFIGFKKKYSNTKENDPAFNINRNFLGIFLLTFCMYSSNDADLSSQLVES